MNTHCFFAPKLNKRRDLVDGSDVIGVDSVNNQLWLVQCTSASNVSARLDEFLS